MGESDKLHRIQYPNSAASQLHNLRRAEAERKSHKGSGGTAPPSVVGSNQVPIVHVEDIAATIVPHYDDNHNYTPYITVNITGDYPTVRSFIGYTVRIFPPIGAALEVDGPSYPSVTSPIDVHSLPTPPHTNETWRIQVRVRTGMYGEGFWSDFVSVSYGGDVVAPRTPTWPPGWLVSNQYNWGAHETSVTVACAAGTPLDGDLDKFVFSSSIDGGATWHEEPGVPWTSPNFTFRHLLPFTDCKIRVRAQDTSGNLSNPSTIQTVTVAGPTPPNPPTAVHESANAYNPAEHLAHVQVAYTLSDSPGIDRYHMLLQRDGLANVEADIGLVSSVDFTVAPDANYYISFYAHNLEGGVSTWTTALHGVGSSATNPSPPTNPRLNTAGYNPPLGYSWQGNGVLFSMLFDRPVGVTVAYYATEIHVTGQPDGALYQVPGNVTGWSFDGLRRTVQYTVTMRTVDNFGHMGLSRLSFNFTGPNEIINPPGSLALDTTYNSPLGYMADASHIGFGSAAFTWATPVVPAGQPPIDHLLAGERNHNILSFPRNATGGIFYSLPIDSLLNLDIRSVTGYNRNSTNNSLGFQILSPYPRAPSSLTKGTEYWDRPSSKWMVPVTWTLPTGYGNIATEADVVITEDGVTRLVVIPTGMPLTSYTIPLNAGADWSADVKIKNAWGNGSGISNVVSGTAGRPPSTSIIPNGSFEIQDPNKGLTYAYLWTPTRTGTASLPRRYTGSTVWDGLWRMQFIVPTGSGNNGSLTSSQVLLAPPAPAGDSGMIAIGLYNLTFVAKSSVAVTRGWNVTVKGYDNTGGPVYTANLMVDQPLTTTWTAYRLPLFAGGPVPANVVSLDFVLSFTNPNLDATAYLDDVQMTVGKRSFEIGPGSVDNSKLTATAALDNIGAGGLTAGYLASGAALSNIGAGGVTAVYLASGAALSNIGTGGVTATYLASGAALSNIGTGGVTATYIAAGAVDNSKLASGAALANIGAGGVTNTYLASGAALANIGAGGVTAAYLASGAALSNIGTGGVTATYIAAASLDNTKMATGFRAIEIVSTLPASFTNYPQGAVVALTTDNTLYRSTGSAWVKTNAAADMTGTITAAQMGAGIALTNIGAGNVTSTYLAFGAALANIGTGNITTTYLAAAAVTTAKLAANSVDNTILASGAALANIGTGGVTATYIAAASLDNTKMATGFRAIEIVSTLPASFTNYPQGAVVALTTDNTLYRSTGSAWVKTNAAADMTGTITAAQMGAGIALTNIGAGNITTTYLAAGAVTTAKMAVNSVDNTILATGAALANIGSRGVTNAYLASTAALDNIGAGGVTNTYLATGAALANIGSGNITSTYIAAASIDSTKLAAKAVKPSNTNLAQTGVLYNGSMEVPNDAGTGPDGWVFSNNCTYINDSSGGTTGDGSRAMQLGQPVATYTLESPRILWTGAGGLADYGARIRWRYLNTSLTAIADTVTIQAKFYDSSGAQTGSATALQTNSGGALAFPSGSAWTQMEAILPTIPAATVWVSILWTVVIGTSGHALSVDALEFEPASKPLTGTLVQIRGGTRGQLKNTWGSGTSFPTSGNLAGDKYMRTDLLKEYIYDGTRWLGPEFMIGSWLYYIGSTAPGTEITTSQEHVYTALRTDYAIYITRLARQGYVNGLTDSTNYWEMTIRTFTGLVGLLTTPLNTKLWGSSTWGYSETATINTQPTTSTKGLEIYVNKVGTPGPLRYSFNVWAREVGT